jgi:hypothetical protein
MIFWSSRGGFSGDGHSTVVEREALNYERGRVELDTPSL